MKIAFLNLYSGTNNRGAESFSHELARRLGEKHEVRFFQGVNYGAQIIQPEHTVKNPLKYFFLDHPNLSVLAFTLKILPELWRRKYDWVIPMNGFWQVFLCKFLPGSKILITGHSGPGWDEKWNLWLKPDVFVATTEPTAQWARKICSWTKVVTIPYGVNIEKFSEARPAKINLEKPIILCPAAAVGYKRVGLAIRAVANLEKGSLLHLGTGPELEKIKELGKKLLGANRFESRSIGYQEMPGYYKACDVVTLPSRPQENSPMVFLEAMAAGKIVVTTKNPRSERILGETGVFINPEDLDSYAQALKDSLGKKMTKNEIDRFSWEKVVEAYLEIFSKTN